MNVGILGSGNVAQTLAGGFLSRGHRVMLGTREASKLAQWLAASGTNAAVGTFAETAAFGEIVVLATLGAATVEILGGIDAEALSGKLVIDVTNPVRSDRGSYELTVGFTDSLGEQVQRAIPSAHVVKCFNTVGAPMMIDPKVPGGPPDMFLAGNDEGAKQQAATIVRDFGWNAVDLGGIEQSRQLEVLCLVWVTYGLRRGAWDHAFKLLHP